MQKVERRSHRDRGQGRALRMLLCAVLLAGCVTAGILLGNKAKEEPEEARQQVTGAITQREAEELESLTVIQRGKDPWTVERETDGSLRLQSRDENTPNTWIVDDSIAPQLVDAAVNLTYEDVLTENRADWEEHAEDYGLQDPTVTAVIRFTDGTEVTARFGDSADHDENAYYYMSITGDDRLFAVAAGTVQDLNIEKELLHPSATPEILGALLDRITVKNGNGSIRAEWALQGQVSDRDAAENWLLTEPAVYPADYDTMKNLRDSAEDLRLGVYIGEATEEELKRCGLDHPSAILEFHMAAGSIGTVSDLGVYDVVDREERTETLILGGNKTEMVAYVRYGDEIYTISHFSVSVFTETYPPSTLARYIVATPLNSLESVLTEKEGEEAVLYSLVRPESGAEAEDAGEEDGEPAIRCLRNGTEIPYSAFSAAYERILTVTVSGRLPDGWQVKPAHTKYTFRTVSGGTHTVELSDYDGMHDAVTMDGHTLFYLIKDGMTELP